MRLRLPLIILALASMAHPGDARAPVQVDGWTLEHHRIAGEARLRARGGREWQGVYVEIVVDERGAVASAGPDPSLAEASPRERGDRFLPEALALARQWRFRPILRDGRPHAVRAIVNVEVLPPERLPRRRSAFPTVPPEQIEVSMRRDECFGTCPAYEVTVRGDGLVRFVGGRHTLGGAHEHRIAPEAAQRLIETFRAANFWSLRRRYVSEVTDHASTELAIRAGARVKRVMDYVGESVGMPEIVRRLQEAVDEAADTARWVRGNARTVAALKAEGFDFRSPAAAALLVAAAETADEAMPLALIERGAPLDALATYCEGCPPVTARRAALDAAVRARRTRLFERLAAGANLSRDDLDALLQSAAFVHSPAIVRRLIALGAPVVPSERGAGLIRALEFVSLDPPATVAEQVEVVGLLIAAGAPVNAQPPAGRNPLQIAAGGDPALVRMLIAAGADVNARAADGEPILHKVEEEDVALIFLAAGADRASRGNGGSLAQIARARGWTEVEALLAAAPR